MHYHPGRAPHDEPILLTPPSPPDPSVPPQSPSVGGAPDMDRMESELKALLAQAQATQVSLVQLQKQDAAGSHVGVLPPLPALPTLPAVDGIAFGLLAALTLVLALTMALRYRRHRLARPGAAAASPESQWQAETDDSRFWTPPDSALEVDGEIIPAPAPAPVPVPTLVPVRPALSEHDTPSTVDESVPAQAPSAIAFDLEAATSEVARVRKTLAQRREARALQRAQDAQRLLEASLQSNEPPKSVDFSLDWDESPVQPPAVAVNPPSHPTPVNPAISVIPAETHMDLEFDIAPEPVLPMTEPAHPAPTTQDVYAIKLALALESEAIELWPEARELASEVLESSDADLQAQAHALLARINEIEGQGEGEGA